MDVRRTVRTSRQKPGQHRRGIPLASRDLTHGTDNLRTVGVLAQEPTRTSGNRTEHIAPTRVCGHDQHAVSHPGDRTHGRRTQPQIQHHDTTGPPPMCPEPHNRLGDPVKLKVRLTTNHLREYRAIQGVVFDHSDRDRTHATTLGNPPPWR